MCIRDRSYIERSTYYYNKHCLKGSRLRREDKVYLTRRNIKITRLSDKLDYKKIRPFEVIEVIGKVNYRLKLLDKMKINLVFYISLLELALVNTLVIAPDLAKEENELVLYEEMCIRDRYISPKPRSLTL